jgi:hypothetical protein
MHGAGRQFRVARNRLIDAETNEETDMNRSDCPARRACLLAVLLLAMALPDALPAQEYHSHHHHRGGVPPMDAECKRLESHGQPHDMTPEMREGLRNKVALYRGMTDRELDMTMNAMGPDYAWYVSDLKLRGDTGVLILSHGVGENSDRLMKKSLQPLAVRRPTAIGFGMSMMDSAHLQAAVDDPVARGAKRIVLVDQGTTTGYNTLSRQWRYIFGMYPEPSYLAVPKVAAPGVQYVWAGHFNDNPMITEMLYDHVKSVSRRPGNETVIIVGHGPEDLEDNGPDLAIIQAHADRIRAKGEFADVRIINLQADAIVPVRESDVRRMRGWVRQANKAGRDVIVVATSAASSGVQQHLKTDLKGLKYTFAEQGLAEHPKFDEWAGSTIDQTLAAGAAKPKAPAPKS